MTMTVSEFQGLAFTGAGPSRVAQAPAEPYLQLTVVSSGGSTGSLSSATFTAATRLVAISQGPAGHGFFFIGSSTATAPTSTQCEIIGANQQVLRGVTPSGKLWAFST